MDRDTNRYSLLSHENIAHFLSFFFSLRVGVFVSQILVSQLFFFFFEEGRDLVMGRLTYPSSRNGTTQEVTEKFFGNNDVSIH